MLTPGSHLWMDPEIILKGFICSDQQKAMMVSDTEYHILFGFIYHLIREVAADI